MSNFQNLYPNFFNDSEFAEIVFQFQDMDADHDGYVVEEELRTILKKINMDTSTENVRELIKLVDKNGNGKLEFDEFLAVLADIKQGKAAGKFGTVIDEHKKLIKVKGAVGTHSYSEEEMQAFTEHIFNCHRDDPHLAYLMPASKKAKDLNLCAAVKDGVLLAKFINVAVPGTIDERALNMKGEKISPFQINENINIVVSAAKSIGASVVNIGAAELTNGEKFPHIILGLVWQLVKIQLLNSINLKNHPELVRLLEEGEELSDLLKLPPDQLLIRWVNYHLKNAGSKKRINNFGGDIKDSEAYTILLHQIAPQTCDASALSDPDVGSRAKKVLANAEKLGVKIFIKPENIVKGNPRLNLAFTAAIFNQCPGLEALSQEELKKVGLMEDDYGDSREERAFRMWINSMNIDNLYINNLFEDCKDGLALLHVIDRIEPGIVAWNKVEMKPNNKFKKVANCNYVVVLGKQLKFSLVSTGGTDITDGNKKLLLGLIWQLMRHHTLKFLAEVQSKKMGSGHIDENSIVEWANKTIQAKGGSSHIESFKDNSLKTGAYLLDLLAAVEPRIINQEYVTPGDTPETALNNARYAISLARKLGCVIFLLPEDIVDVKPKMIFTFVASIMAVAP